MNATWTQTIELFEQYAQTLRIGDERHHDLAANAAWMIASAPGRTPARARRSQQHGSPIANSGRPSRPARVRRSATQTQGL